MYQIVEVLKIVWNVFRLGCLKIVKQGTVTFKGRQRINFDNEISIRGEKSNITLGNNITTGKNVCFRIRNGNLKLGDKAYFNNGCMVVCYEEIKIGSGCSFGPNVMIFDHDHDYKHPEGIKANIYKTAGITIGNNVWVGANSVILRGSKIGDNCVIGAGCIVKGDIPMNTIFTHDREGSIKEYNARITY